MANNIAVSITADVADLQVKRAILSAELKTAQKDLNDFAKTARTSGLTDELKTSMLGAADALTKTRNQVNLVDRELKSMRGGAAEAEGAMEGLHVGTAGVTRELIVLAREAGRGNFSRMAGSATILIQRLGLLTPTVLATAAGIGLLAVPIIAVVAAMESASGDLAKFQNDIQLTGNFAGLTASQFEDMAKRVATASNTGLGSARNTLLALTASGRFTGEEIEQLGRDATKFSELTGRSSKEVLADFVKMADGPTHYAEEFNRTYHALTLAQIEHIKQLEDQGQKSEATAALVQDLTHWLDDQAVHMGPLQSAWHGLKSAIDDAWQSFKQFTNSDLKWSPDAQLAKVNAQIAEIQKTGRLDGFVVSPEVTANLEKQRAALEAKVNAQRQSADADARSTRLQAEAQDAFDKSHTTMEGLKSSAQAAREAVAALHAEMAKRLEANPNDKEAQDYMANQAKYDQALMHKMDPGDFKKSKAPDAVSEWTQQLHAQEIASGEFFRDQTAAELKFWQDKVALTTAGSKDWLSVQDKIFSAQKTLAHQAYDDHLATLNAQIEADRDNWSKEQADWNAKLEFIKAHYGAESSEYQNAFREFERAQSQHDDRMAQIRRQASQQQLSELQENLRIEQEIRQRDAQTQEALIKSRAQYSANPLAAVAAEQQIAQLQAQAIQQQIEALNQEHAARSAIVEQDIALAVQQNQTETQQYAQLLREKKQLDAQYFNQRRVLVDQAANQEIQAQQRVQAAWHANIDPMVHSAGSAIQGLITGTMTWQQAIASVGQAMLSVVIGALERVAEQMIVNAIMQRTAQTASAEAGVMASAAQAGAAGVASMAAAPFPLDLGAPAFGAEMYATAMSFGLGGFEKGLDVVPNDMIAQIHEGERIVPKADNRAIISALAGGGASQSAQPAVAAEASQVHHHWHIQAVDAKSFAQLLNDNPRTLQRALQQQVGRLTVGVGR